MQIKRYRIKIGKAPAKSYPATSLKSAIQQALVMPGTQWRMKPLHYPRSFVSAVGLPGKKLRKVHKTRARRSR